MRILLAQNSQYFPAHGGGDKSNRLLIEALAARGHDCMAVARTSQFGEEARERYLNQLRSRQVEYAMAAPGVVAFRRNGVAAEVVTDAGLRAHFVARTAAFQPDVVIASTDDPANLLLEAALKTPARVVYLARATLAVPFGPDSAFPSESKTALIRRADAVVGVSEYVARYIREWARIPAVHVPISLLEPGEWPALGRFDNEFVTMANPCAVKGVSIFLALADAMPSVRFAAVPTWGTTSEDRRALESRRNVWVLDPVDDIDRLLARTRVLLVPSLWAEARSRIIVEAMLRGVPVLASDVGGIPEAKMGVPYLLPVRPIERYRTQLDEQMVPVAEAPAQNVAPWLEALEGLTTNPTLYREISEASRCVALEYAERLNVEPFERLLAETLTRPKQAAPTPAAAPREELSAEKRRLLAIRLRQKAGPAAWFPGAEGEARVRVFCFPHAGGGAAAFAGWTLGDGVKVCPVRLPGREARLAEAPFERMAPLIEALGEAFRPYLGGPFVFFGHSMGAVVAFELARWLRRGRLAQPLALLVSGARAPQFRRNHVPPPDPDDETFLVEVRRLQGIPPEVLETPDLMRVILPALRADAALYRRYIYTEEAPLSMPIRAYGGDADPNIRRDHLEAWAEQTSSSYALRVLEGGHFFLHSSRAGMLEWLRRDVEETC